MRIPKICAYCKKEFFAKKTTSNTCSDTCAKGFYKEKKRNEKITQAVMQTEIIKKPNDYITEERIKTISAKQFLDLKEAALLMNVSPLTFRRWILCGKVTSHKVGKKHLILKSNLNLIISREQS